jgi:uncharacterized membrane protein YdjX (TVP38/TMEM64 family)
VVKVGRQRGIYNTVAVPVSQYRDREGAAGDPTRSRNQGNVKLYPLVLLAIAAALFAVVQATDSLHIPVLVDPWPWLQQGGPLAALVGVGLLIADVALPVPSSGVMIANGALFGVGLGALLSLVGSVAAAVVAFSVGRSGGPLLARLLPRHEQASVARLLDTWGALAIVVTRPVPILAEATAIAAGASPIGWRAAIAAALAGSLPAALLYAIVGATAASFENHALVFGLVVIMAAAFWLLSHEVRRRQSTGVME